MYRFDNMTSLINEEVGGSNPLSGCNLPVQLSWLEHLISTCNYIQVLVFPAQTIFPSFFQHMYPRFLPILVANVNYSSSQLGIKSRLGESLFVSTSVILCIYLLFFTLSGNLNMRKSVVRIRSQASSCLCSSVGQSTSLVALVFFLELHISPTCPFLFGSTHNTHAIN